MGFGKASVTFPLMATWLLTLVIFRFNWAARKLKVRLLQLGATEFFKSAEADERHDNG